MKKKRTFLFILFCTMTIVLTGSLLFRQAISSNKNYFKSSTLAANSTCTVDGKSYGSYNFSFRATELTSGVDYWQCHTTSGYWTTCPNSNGCRTYKVNADSGYDQIRTYDIAGNVSSIRYLYKKNIIQLASVQDSTYVSLSGEGIGKVKLINSFYQRKGTISDAYIRNEKISVTGRTEGCEKTVYYNATKDYIKVCKLGTYNERTGKCEAESYRLQNDTCYCEYKAVDNKLKTINPSNPGNCVRTHTYCTDEFRSSDNYVTKYKNATSIHKYGAVGILCTGASSEWGSSCDFERPANSVCNAHYDNIVNVLNENITSYEDYKSKIATGDRSSSTMSKVASFATAGNPCEKSGNYTASYDFNTVCKKLEGKSTGIGVKTKNSTGETIYIVPIILSAPCNWVAKAPTENNSNYGKYPQKVVGDSFYYCDDDADGITNDYQCYKTVTKQCYDYTVEYYYEG